MGLRSFFKDLEDDGKDVAKDVASLATNLYADVLFPGYGDYEDGKQQEKATKAAYQQAQQSAMRTADRAEQEINRANQKRPNIGALLSGSSQAGRAGISGTMLTGPAGVDPNALLLGRNTLLGA